MPKSDYSCPGCNKVYARSQELTKHRKSCTAYMAQLSAVPQYELPERPNGGWRKLVNIPTFTRPSRKRKKPPSRTSDSDDMMEVDPTPNVDNPPESPYRDHSSTPASAPAPLASATAPDETEPPPRESRRTRGVIPARYRDMLPSGTMPDPELHVDDTPPPPPPEFIMAGTLRSVRIRLRRTLRSARNAFGLSRLYADKPDSIPADFAPLADGTNPFVAGPLDSGPVMNDQGAPLTGEEIIAPYPNFSSFLFNNWFWKRRQKSQADRRDLQNVITHPNFRSADVKGVNFDALDKRLASGEGDSSSLGRGWRRSTVHLDVPHGQKRTKHSRNLPINPERCIFDINGVLHRSIPRLIEEEFSKPTASNFHYTPFRLVWQRPGSQGVEENVYSEVYNSQAFLDEHLRLQSLPPENGCDLPRAVAATMLLSDTGHLTETGTAKIHPLNGMFGNQPSVERNRPTCRAVHPVAYFHELPVSEVQDFMRDMPNGKSRKKDHPVFTHLRRELLHKTLGLALDDEFWHAYDHGIVVDCADGVRRRLYPRLFTYTADYPEKCLVSTIREGGLFPCPSDLTPEVELDQMGTAAARQQLRDRWRLDNAERRKSVEKAHTLIHKRGYAVNGKRVDALLKEGSYTPTKNALSHPERPDEHNVFSLFLPDSLHEIGGGTWLATLRHLIRILETLPDGADRVITLNQRFRQISAFGRDSIRQLSDHIADLTRMSIHEYETILKDAAPCFEGLFPDLEFDAFVQDMLFTFARWHGSAKLTMHTDSSLRRMDKCTIDLGNMLRHFQITSAEKYPTVETAAEADKRVRKAQAEGRVASSTRKPKTLNIATYKFHSMDHYIPGISRIGTTNNYTTAIQEASLREPNDDFLRTSKRNFVPQIIRNAIRKQVHFDMRTKLARIGIDIDTKTSTIVRQRDETHFTGDPTCSYHLAERDGRNFSLRSLDEDHFGDPAFYDFLPKLQSHCLARLANLPSRHATFPHADYSAIEFDKHRIYPHARVSVNYTTYAVQRAQDPIGINTQKRDIMLLAPSHAQTGSPYAYARVLGVYHVKVKHPILTKGKGFTRLDVLHVRWFRLDVNFPSGWSSRRLDRIQFVPSSEADAFGFVDPSEVIRGSHLIPAFAHGRTTDLLRSLGQSVADGSPDGDWRYYYVARFADCDMMMRFTDLGVGHEGARPAHIDMTEPEPFPEVARPTTSRGDAWDDNADFAAPDAELETIEEQPEEGDGE